ncbi:M20 family metallopeptidase [Brevibacillus agri]|uniref:M20 family metallopeptidase n=1 Tax=Brevibacillus TaxID=55080 RepID=UPI0002719135|nr:MULTISPECIES: M20 family metallopeptidase [Brevibacillus]EJL39186.1 acetylornithine deacetylase/succinyldiaminopimelate desuccinylase-like deacylase [Brevibacillus sp. CF112]MBG9567645.1 peptidase [Brevibacillus agri]MED1646235.1 M20 family metallopeptidase [Brevibacillus agri]MED1654170.1 M20 family metallopeptidase [Brevibacillus agri]MED1688075.1 M20 family metallopeptidase [Brevibacillus agri]
MSIQTYLQDNMNHFLQLLEEAVNMDSPSRDKRLGDRMAGWFALQFQRLTGGRAELIPNATYGDQVRCTLGEGDKQILIIGHYDTVWLEGEAARRPFSIRDEKAYGPGVYDMKAGILQAMFALRALVKLDRLPADKKIVLLLNSDEEIGSPTSRWLVEQEASRSAASFVLEPPTEPGGALKTWRKGSAHYTVAVRGISAHAGVDHQKGVSAIEELSRQIQFLHALTDYEKGTTINVGVVKGGIGANVVADYAEAEVDVRVVSMEEAQRIENVIRERKPLLSGTSINVTGGIRRPPMERTKDTGVLFALAKSISRHELGMELEESGTGGVSDGNFAAACGVPTLDGLGAKGGFAHSPEEWIELGEISTRATLLARLIEEV